MPETDGEAKPGVFRWNAGWFGGQLGATLWIALLGAMLLPDAPGLGALVITFALVPNVFGVALWRMRRRVRPYPAIQMLIAVAAVFALATFVALDVAGRISALRAGEGRRVYLVLLIYPGLMLVFHVKQRAAPAARSAQTTEDRKGKDT